MIKNEKEFKKKVREDKDIDENIRITRSDPGPRKNIRDRVRRYPSPGSSVGIIFRDNRGVERV